jgi:dihydrofolate reductase
MDGVMDTPSWTAQFGFDPRMGEAIGSLMGSCESLLLGRRTYEMFEPAWSPRTAEDDPGAPFMNESTKYVVSATLTDPTWRNTEVVGAYNPNVIRALKDRVAGGMYVSGSNTLVRSLIADGLVDELHMFVFPLVRGVDERLFPQGASGTWGLHHHEAYANGVVYLAYTAAS